MKKQGKLIAFLLTAAMALTGLTACGSSPAGTTSSAGTDSAAGASSTATADDNAGAQDASLSDTLVFAQGSEPRGLDPALVDDGESSKVIVNIYEGLLQFAEDSTNVEPCLAKSWDVAEDGMSYTFHLQEGVKFHDGEPFNAEAVKFNIDRQLPPQVTEDMGYASFVFGQVKDVEVVDEYTVKINMSEPCTPFLNNLAMSLGAPMVSPKALQDNDNNVNETPVGTGPYKFVRWDKSQDVVLVRNDEYWGEKAKTQNVIFRFIPDNSARVVALTNGEVDMIDGIDATVVEQIKSAGYSILGPDGMNINYMAYNTERAPFDKKENRIAVSQAINVPELVTSLYQGYASTATTVMPSFMPGYSDSVKQAAYDEAAAKTALEAAGITELHMITYTNPRPYNTANGQVLAEAIQGYLSKVGVTATIDSYDWSTYKEKVKTGDFDICFYGWIGDNGDPDNFMNLLADSDPTMNVARYNSQAFKDKLAEGLKTPAGDARNAIYAELEQMQADEAPWLVISHQQNLSAYSPKMQDYYYHVTGNVFFKGMSKLA